MPMRPTSTEVHLLDRQLSGPPTRTHFAAHRIEFERKHKMHYDEGKALALAKKSIVSVIACDL